MKPVIISVLAALLVVGCATKIPRPGANYRYEGIWVTQDADQGIFNIEISKDGTALTNFYKGPAGAKGERGTWKKEGDSVFLEYKSGWRDFIDPNWRRMTFRHRGYEPGVSLEDTPTNIGPALPLSGKGAEFIGVWKLGPTERYLALVSDGTAARTFPEEKSTIVGTWRVTEKGVAVNWDDKSSVTITRGSMKTYQAVLVLAGASETVAAKKQTGKDL